MPVLVRKLFHQAGEVVVHVLKHHIDAALDGWVLQVRWARHDLLEVDYVPVFFRLQNLDFSYGGDWESFFFVVELELLQRDPISSFLLRRQVHASVRSLSNLPHDVEHVYGSLAPPYSRATVVTCAFSVVVRVRVSVSVL